MRDRTIDVDEPKLPYDILLNQFIIRCALIIAPGRFTCRRTGRGACGIIGRASVARRIVRADERARSRSQARKNNDIGDGTGGGQYPHWY